MLIKKHFVWCCLSAAFRLHIWWLKSHWWIHNTDISPSLPLHSPTSQWQQNWKADTDIVSQRFLMLPAQRRHVSQLTYSGHWQKFTRSQAFQPGHHRSRYLRTYQQWWQWGVTLIPILGNRNQRLSSLGLVWLGEKKEERSKLIYFLLW